MDRFEPKETITKWISEVYALTENLNRGDVLTHHAIRKVLRLRPHEGSWDHVVGRARRKLEDERGISTLPDVTVGYRLCTEDEQIRIPINRTRRAIRQARKGQRSLESLPNRGLTVHQQNMRSRLLDLSVTQLESLRRTLREQNEEIRATPVIPLRPMD